MTFTEYMSQTEFAIRQLFDSLKHYHDLLEKERSIRPVFSTTGCNEDEHWDKAKKFFDDNKKQNDEANKLSAELLGLKNSQAIICGSILQNAHMLISLFSKYSGDCLVLDGEYKKFGVGRLVNNIPLGLVIYAGRNQYNHWDTTMQSRNKKIFDLIATRNNELDYKDPCFNLELGSIDIYSHNIIGLLGWKTYEEYEKDMLDILSNYEE